MKFNPSFSRFNHVRYDKNPRTVTLSDFLEEIRSDRHKATCDFLRSTTDKDAKSKAKGKLPCVTLSAICEGGHGKENMRSYSRLLQLDFDLADNPLLEGFETRLFARLNLSIAPHVVSVFESPSGGLKAVVLTEAKTFEDHKRGFEAAQSWAAELNLVGDSGVSDESRACYLSHDPSAHLALNIELLDEATEGSEYDEERDQHFRALPFVPLPIAEVKEDPIFEPVRPVNSAPSQKFEGGSPIDAYNASEAWKDELRGIGWSEPETDHWRHPNANAEHSATWGKVKGNLHVFSSNAEPLKIDHNYRPFDILKACRFFNTAEAVAFLRGDSLPKLSPEVEASIAALVETAAERKQAEEVPSVFATFDDNILSEPQPVPEVCKINGADFALFYKAEMNEIHGEPGIGKTWICDCAIAEELKAGRDVIYIDPESNKRSAAGRLCNVLGVPLAKLQKHLKYTNNFDDFKRTFAEVHALAKQGNISLAVVDGLAEVIAMTGCNENENSECLEFLNLYIKPISKVGACVVLVDHTGKNKTDKDARGASSKKGAYKGAVYHVEARTPFDKENDGVLLITTKKDNNGGAGSRNKVRAQLVVTHTDSTTAFDLRTPSNVEGQIVSAGRSEEHTPEEIRAMLPTGFENAEIFTTIDAKGLKIKKKAFTDKCKEMEGVHVEMQPDENGQKKNHFWKD